MTDAIALPACSVNMNALHDAAMLKKEAERDKAIQAALEQYAPVAEVAPLPAETLAASETPAPVGDV